MKAHEGVAILWLLLTVGHALYAASPKISVQTELESTRATVSCQDGKIPNQRTIDSPTGRKLLILDCVRGQ